MSRQYFADVLSEPYGGTAYATITATTATTLIPTAACPIAAGEGRPGKVYELLVGGTVTTGTAGTLTLTAFMGASGTTAFGSAGPIQNYVPSITTAPFILRAYVSILAVSQPGANSTAVCTAFWNSGGAVATAASESSAYVYATTSTMDCSIAQLFSINVTFSVAPSVVPKWHTWRSLN